MSTPFNDSTVEQVFQGSDEDKIIARPGEPIANIDAVTARRKVSGYIGREISLMMGGKDPALVYSGGRLVWRVPIIFTTPFRGQLGVVGVLDIDARTSEILIPPNLEQTLHSNADALLKSSPYSPEK